MIVPALSAELGLRAPLCVARDSLLPLREKVDAQSAAG
jgi:hypothetical protein